MGTGYIPGRIRYANRLVIMELFLDGIIYIYIYIDEIALRREDRSSRIKIWVSFVGNRQGSENVKFKILFPSLFEITQKFNYAIFKIYT